MSDAANIAIILAVWIAGIFLAWIGHVFECHVSKSRKVEYQRGFRDGRFTKKAPPQHDTN